MNSKISDFGTISSSTICLIEGSLYLKVTKSKGSPRPKTNLESIRRGEGESMVLREGDEVVDSKT